MPFVDNIVKLNQHAPAMVYNYLPGGGGKRGDASLQTLERSSGLRLPDTKNALVLKPHQEEVLKEEPNRLEAEKEAKPIPRLIDMQSSFQDSSSDDKLMLFERSISSMGTQDSFDKAIDKVLNPSRRIRRMLRVSRSELQETLENVEEVVEEDYQDGRKEVKQLIETTSLGQLDRSTANFSIGISLNSDDDQNTVFTENSCDLKLALESLSRFKFSPKFQHRQTPVNSGLSCTLEEHSSQSISIDPARKDGTVVPVSMDTPGFPSSSSSTPPILSDDARWEHRGKANVSDYVLMSKKGFAPSKHRHSRRNSLSSLIHSSSSHMDAPVALHHGPLEPSEHSVVTLSTSSSGSTTDRWGSNSSTNADRFLRKPRRSNTESSRTNSNQESTRKERTVEHKPRYRRASMGSVFMPQEASHTNASSGPSKEPRPELDHQENGTRTLQLKASSRRSRRQARRASMDQMVVHSGSNMEESGIARPHSRQSSTNSISVGGQERCQRKRRKGTMSCSEEVLLSERKGNPVDTAHVTKNPDLIENGRFSVVKATGSRSLSELLQRTKSYRENNLGGESESVQVHFP